MNARRVAVGAAFLAMVGAGCGEIDCRHVAIGDSVRVEVPTDWVGSEGVSLCVDDECHDGLAVVGGTIGVVQFGTTTEMKTSVHLKLAITKPVARAVEGTVSTHKTYPGCLESLVAAARFDPATGKLVQSDWDFVAPASSR
jgi:hypothetical protein